MLETELIEIIKQKTQSQFIGDDCAVVSLGDKEFLFSVDNFVEQTHFDCSYFTPHAIGWKALAVNLSDIAAMGGIPLYALISIALAKNIQDSKTWIRDFYQGINDCAKETKLEVIGGDLCSQAKLSSISITIIGQTHKKGALLRSSAKLKDKVCVTGKFGNSGSFLASKLEIDQAKHLYPQARIKEAQNIFLNNNRAALIDSSDGLAVSLIELAKQSRVTIEINSGAIPKDEHIDLHTALYGGEDYELVGCFENIPEGFSQIGEVTQGNTNNPNVIDIASKSQIRLQGCFEHF